MWMRALFLDGRNTAKIFFKKDWPLLWLQSD